MIAAKVRKLLRCYQDALDKPPTQYPLTHRSEWRTLQGCCKFQSANVHIYGCVFHNICRQNTHSHDTFVHVQVMRTLPAPMCHSPREHAWLKGAQDSHCGVSETTCHPSVISHMLPLLSLHTSAGSLSPTSTLFRPSSPSLSCPSDLHQETLPDSRRSAGCTKCASSTT